MKLVREHINEKFREESDPIKDMNIGIYVKRNFNSKEEFLNFLIEVIPGIIGESEIPEDIIYCYEIIRNDIFAKVDAYLNEYTTFNGYPGPGNRVYFDEEGGFWNRALRKLLIKKGYKYLN